MEIHTRAIVKARRSTNYPVWEFVTDFGIPYTPDRDKAMENPLVKEQVEKLKQRFAVVSVDFHDA